ncbi:hypothetical protein D0C36_22935 [Mucilaginibacter conchicola]|uniref:Response regulator n=1 Tax=Mucilaginibacter conchicola TaxID=2303333 RepID=A0A372NN77_9SPHI|nr:hypothetical protein [Mucilaginibacter conchicola]RFZ90100.1 hypothetical protein D0C36_22935 [Mucilaginibacter conchicola]
MNGLLVEDDQTKANKIIDIINEKCPGVNLSLESSYQNGLNAIFNYPFDFILLDMSLPTYDQINGNFSGKPKGFGGSNILKEMRRYGKTAVVKVITQYNEFDGTVSMKDLDAELKTTYPTLYRGYITYAAKRTEWVEELCEFIKSMMNGIPNCR